MSNEVWESTSLSAAMDAEGKVLVTWTCCSYRGNGVLHGRWFDRTGAPRAEPCVHRDGRFRCDTRRNGSADLIIPFASRGAIPLLGNLDGL